MQASPAPSRKRRAVNFLNAESTVFIIQLHHGNLVILLHYKQYAMTTSLFVSNLRSNLMQVSIVTGEREL